MRRRLLLAAGLCAAAAAAVWFAAFHVAAVQRLDLQLLERMLWRGGPRAEQLASDLLSFFDPGPGALLAVVLVAGAALAGRRRAAVLAGVVVAGSALSAHFLKAALAAQRDFPLWHYLPPESWPSGHTAGAVSLSIALVIVSPPALRWLAVIVAGAVSGTTMVAILVLGTHYPSDVLGGVLITIGWACLAGAALPSAVTARLPQRLPAAGGDVEAA